MIAAHLPALQVVIPLMAAPLCVLLRRPVLAWALTLAVSWVVLAIAVALLLQVLESGPVTYPLGNWAAPWGIEYRVDLAGAFVLVIVAAIGAVVTPYARRSVEHEIPRDRIYLFYAMYLLCLTGLLGIAITGDAFNLFVFLEITSLSSYVLISLGSERRALTAAYRYLIMGTLGATFYLIGVAMMYMMTGTLNMADLATLMPAVADTRTILVALAFLTVGISLKLALFPLHVEVFQIKIIGDVLMGLAILAMVSGSAVAIYQNNVKRMLAYSSVAQIGYMVLGISFATVTGLTGGIVHLFNHALVKCALFMALGCVFMRIGSVNIQDMAGLGRRMPVTMASFVISGLSLIGVPLTVGFVSKWYLVQAALEKGWWPIAVLVLLSSLLAVIYIWRVVEVAYFRPAPEGGPAPAEAPLSMLVPMWLLTGATVYFGIDATRTLEVAGGAAAFLLRATP